MTNNSEPRSRPHAPLDPYSEQLSRLLDSARARHGEIRDDDCLRPALSDFSIPETRALRAHVLSRVEQVKGLPSPPDIMRRLDRALAQPRANARTIADVLQYDPGLAGKVLGLANSALYGFRSEVRRIDQAVALLGVDAIRTLVLTVSVFRAFGPHRDCSLLDPYRFWEHSITVALGSRLIATSLNDDSTETIDADMAFLAGLLHDVGKVVIAQHFAEDYADIRALAQDESVLLYDAELAILGVRHTDIAHQLLCEWGLPADLTTSVRFHHEPGSGGTLSYVVHLADLMARGLGIFPEIEEVPRADPLLWVRLGLSDEVVESISHQVLDSLGEIRHLIMGSPEKASGGRR